MQRPIQQQFPPSSNAVDILQVSLSLLLKATALLLLVTIILRFHALSQAEARQQAEQLEQTKLILRLEQLKSSQSYDLCITEAQQVSLTSRYRPQAMTLASQCQDLATAAIVSRAQALAAAGQPQAAIAEVRPILDRAGVRTWFDSWARQILRTAEVYYQDPNGGLQPAMQAMGAIASDKALSPEVQQQLADWQKDWSKNQTHWQAAHLALGAQQIQQALSEIQQITHPYWRQQAQPLVDAIYAKLQPQNDFQPASQPTSQPAAPPTVAQPARQSAAQPAAQPPRPPAEPNYIRVQEDSEGLIFTGKFLLPVGLGAVMIALIQLKSR